MASKSVVCKARQYSDQMVCNHCSTVWDINDPDKPVCKEEERLERSLHPDLDVPISDRPF